MVLKTRLPDAHQAPVDIPSIATITTVDVIFTGLKGVKVGELYLVAFDLATLDAGLGYSATAHSLADNALTVRFVNPTAGAINPDPGVVMTFIKL
jgi:putative effector of murein hydrolase